MSSEISKPALLTTLPQTKQDWDALPNEWEFEVMLGNLSNAVQTIGQQAQVGYQTRELEHLARTRGLDTSTRYDCNPARYILTFKRHYDNKALTNSRRALQPSNELPKGSRGHTPKGDSAIDIEAVVIQPAKKRLPAKKR